MKRLLRDVPRFEGPRVVPDVVVDAVVRHLWPGEVTRGEAQVYGLLDAACDDRIYRAVMNSQLEWACLYTGSLHPDLAAAAPYLVHLHADAHLTRSLLAHGFGRSWCSFVVSAARLGELHQHFRRFLRVVDEDGQRLIFRYYDPRVLRAYLPTCTAEELGTVFGPVAQFVVEGPKYPSLLEFTRTDEDLDTLEWDLAEAEWTADAEPASRSVT